MNLLPFSRKSMRVQDLKQQTAIRLAQEQQRQNNNNDVVQQQQQPNATHHHHYRQSNHEYGASGYNNNNVQSCYHQSNNDYQQHQHHQHHRVPPQDVYGNNNHFGGGMDKDDRKTTTTTAYSNKLMSPSSVSQPSTPRNRHKPKQQQQQQSTREKKQDKTGVEPHGMVCPNAHIVASPYVVDPPQYNKGKQGSGGGVQKNQQIKSSKAKEQQRRNQDGIEIGPKSNHSPMGRHGKQYSRHATSSPHGGAQSYNSQQYYHHMHQGHVATPRGNTQRYTPNKSSKLPHGLTVQELKEMTKARLAAEAFENQDHDNNMHSNNDYHHHSTSSVHQNHPHVEFSPPPVVNSMYHNEVPHRQDLRYRHHYQQNRQRIHSEGLATTEYAMRQRLNSAESTASAPPITMYASQSDHSMIRNISQNSLNDQYPPHVVNQEMHYRPQMPRNEKSHFSQNNNNNNNNTSRSMQQHSFDFGQPTASFNGPSPNRVHSKSQEFRYNQDVLDTASVNSINSGLESEYLGSESQQHPPGFYNTNNNHHQNNPDFNDGNSRYAFGRSCSYPTGANLGYAVENNRDTSAFSPFHNNMNRSRAATASPHGLSNVLEDRPVMDGINGNFSTSSHDLTLHHPKVNNSGIDGYNSPRGSNCSSPASSRFGACNFIPDAQWYDIFGRPSSSTTVPTVEQSAESFYVNDDDAHQPLDFGPPSHGTSSGSNSNNELPNSVAESVLGNAILDNSQKYTYDKSVNIKRDATVAGVSGVFRNVNQHHYSETYPDLNHTFSENKTFDSGIIGQKTVSSSMSDPRDEVNGFSNTSNDFSSENDFINNAASMRQLENDLNSLLNIIGDEGTAQNDSDMNLIPKIDPEVDITTPQPSLVANSSSSASGDAVHNFSRNNTVSSKKNSFIFF